MENKTDIEITVEDFKLIKSFYPELTRIHNVISNNFIIGWSELMPVVEKIYTSKTYEVPSTGRLVGLDITISPNFCSIYLPDTTEGYDWVDDCWCANPLFSVRFAGCESTIEAVYKSVIQFIKWYNNHGK